MKCRYCKNEIPEGSIFCNWCGKKQLKERKKKDEITVPAPRQLPSGKWFIQLRAERASITEPTKEQCVAKAIAIRAGYLKGKCEKKQMKTLRQGIDDYIARRSNVLSPATVRGYRQIQRNRFQNIMDKPLSADTDWQKVCNDEMEGLSVRTIENAWGLVSAVLRENNLHVPDVKLKEAPPRTRPWLDEKQIPIFIQALMDEHHKYVSEGKGDKSCAIPALMALCSMRRSEIMAVDWEDVGRDYKTIRVSGAIVQADGNRYVEKEENKNKTSTRVIPILIPELADLLKAERKASGKVVTVYPDTIRKYINKVCKKAGLPAVGTHGLRHSFASLAYYLQLPEKVTQQIGGWADDATMKKIYTHISQSHINEKTQQLADFYKKGDFY